MKPYLFPEKKDAKIKIAITRHRDIWAWNEANSWTNGIKAKYPDATIITGGALGIDQTFAQCAIGKGLEHWLYLPFPHDIMTARWGEKSKRRLETIMENSTKIDIIGDEYDIEHYQKRNMRMINDADIIIGFWDGRKKE